MNPANSTKTNTASILVFIARHVPGRALGSACGGFPALNPAVNSLGHSGLLEIVRPDTRSTFNVAFSRALSVRRWAFGRRGTLPRGRPRRSFMLLNRLFFSSGLRPRVLRFPMGIPKIKVPQVNRQRQCRLENSNRILPVNGKIKESQN